MLSMLVGVCETIRPLTGRKIVIKEDVDMEATKYGMDKTSRTPFIVSIITPIALSHKKKSERTEVGDGLKKLTYAQALKAEVRREITRNQHNSFAVCIPTIAQELSE